jgi:hypothetical protein
MRMPGEPASLRSAPTSVRASTAGLRVPPLEPHRNKRAIGSTSAEAAGPGPSGPSLVPGNAARHFTPNGTHTLATAAAECRNDRQAAVRLAEPAGLSGDPHPRVHQPSSRPSRRAVVKLGSTQPRPRFLPPLGLRATPQQVPAAPARDRPRPGVASPRPRGTALRQTGGRALAEPRRTPREVVPGRRSCGRSEGSPSAIRPPLRP